MYNFVREFGGGGHWAGATLYYFYYLEELVLLGREYDVVSLRNFNVITI